MVQAIDIDTILSVYNGKANRCCCGCSGTHSYPSKYREEASENRGYKVTDDEIDDKRVQRIVNKIVKDPRSTDDGYAYVLETDTRWYIAYKRG